MATAGFFNILAADSGGISTFWGYIIIGAFIVIGLLLIGRHDVVRFSLKRTWAISGVCFAESIRRKVLWLTPLAMIAVILITQFERALDEQDALRQTVKICLFATGTVIILTSVILACTNLPKEIESRVIYTIVTKPTTRLEIVLGKIVGFSRVSLAILLIMGFFTWAYLRIRAGEKGSEISVRLSDGNLSDAERARLNSYEKTGLLISRSFQIPLELQVFGAKPDPANEQYRILGGNNDQDLLAGYQMIRKNFYLDEPASQDPDEWDRQGIGENGLLIRVELNSTRTGKPNDQPEAVASPVLGPAAPTTQPGNAKLLQPFVSICLVDENHYEIVTQNMIGGTDVQAITANISEYYKTRSGTGAIPAKLGAGAIRLSEPRRTPDGRTVQFAYAWVPPESAASLFSHTDFFVRVNGVSENVNYQAGRHPVRLFIPQITKAGPQLEPPAATEIAASPDRFGHEQLLVFVGKTGLRLDQQIEGGPDHPAVADYSFIDSGPAQSHSSQDETTFQFTPLVTRENAQISEGDDDPTTLDIDIVDNDAKKITASTTVQVETNRPAYFTVPTSSLGSGNFDMLFHCRNTGQTVGLQPRALEMITGVDSFEFNLTKSLAIIWLMSILVISISIFCSTFLSWPIAVVLTLVLLVGRWGVTQLADTNTAGLGRQIVNDFKFNDAAVSSVVSSSVDALSKGLNTLATVLPDLSRFNAIDDLQNGISLSMTRLTDSIWGLLAFAIPAVIAAYVILRNKEVAP